MRIPRLGALLPSATRRPLPPRPSVRRLPSRFSAAAFSSHPAPASPRPASSPAETSPASPAMAAPNADRALPAPGDEGTTTTMTLDVSGGGTTVKLDALGPVVVNTDGTVARVSNWAQMTEIEQQNTLRILGKRNKQRLEVLRGEGKEPKIDTGNASKSDSGGK